MFRPLAALLLLAFSPAALAQDCASYALFDQGTELTYTHYDRHDKEVGTTTTTVKEAGPADDGYQAQLHSVQTDAKATSSHAVGYTATCSGGELKIDMRAFVPEEQMKAFGSYDIHFEGSELQYPATLTVGKTLPDGKLTADMTMQDAAPAMPAAMTHQTMQVDLVDRKVVAAEPITTPAGTFDSYKITYVSRIAVKGLVSIHSEAPIVAWYVPGLGGVKSETLHKGNVRASTVLTALKRP